MEEFTFELDDLTKQKLKCLSNAMALSIRTLIESAISYTCSYAIKTQKTAAKLQPMMPSPSRFSIHISLSI